MEIDRRLVQLSYFHDYLPHWICPLCNKGFLHAKKRDVIINESEASKAEHGEKYFSYEMCHGSFSGKLRCENPKCKEITFIAGDAQMDKDYTNVDEEGHVLEYTYVWGIYPRYFSKPIKLFPIDKYPDWVKSLLNEAFLLLWVDTSSCANKIRILVEAILTNQGISKYKPKAKNQVKPSKPGTSKRLESLQARIGLLKNKEAAHFIEAVKWLGNAGSHSSDSLNREDVLDAFEMIDEALTILYNPHKKKITVKAQKINKSKGPQKPKRFKFGVF